MRVAIAVSVGLVVGVLAPPAYTQETSASVHTVLADLKQETGEASTRLVIVGSAKPNFTRHSPDPLTLVVDIADADASRLPARLEVATREIESLRVSTLARGDGHTTARVEIRLAALAPFTVEESGNDLIVTVSRPSTPPATTANMPPVQKEAATEPSRNSSPKTAAPKPAAMSAGTAPRATRISGVTRMEGELVGYHVNGNGTLKPEAFLLRNPDRIVIDFPDVVAGRSPLPAAAGPVRGVRLAQFSSAPPRVARLVLEVDRATPYHLVPDATGVAVVFGEGAPAPPALLGAPPASPAPPPPAPDAALND